MSPFVDEKAPYALALLVTLLGWFLTNAVTEADKSVLISYDLAPFSSGDEDYLRLHVRNQSLSLAMRNIPIVVQCSSGQNCLTRENEMTRNSFAVPNAVGSWRVRANPAPPPPDTTTNVLLFTPEIPARAELELILGHAKGTTQPSVSFELPAGTERTPQLERGYSIRGFIFQNWFWVLLAGGAALSVILVLWLAASTRAKPA